MELAKTNNARLDIRLPKELKDEFEKATKIGRFKTVSEFVVSTVRQRAEEIISENERVLASRKDAEIFFNAIINPQEPNRALRDAAEEFKKLNG